MHVEFEEVRFERHGRRVLEIPALRVRGGRITAILGPNGSGKTTLLRLIAALERPCGGQILIGGAPVRQDLSTRRHIAYVFQEQVFLRRSVRANLELGLRLRGVSRGETRTRIAEAANLLGIAAILDRPANALSGGEARRASLARALCLRAPLVLLDEPLAGLDGPTYARLLDELPQLLTSFGATTLLVTHDRHEALRLGEDLVVLIDGRVHASGDKREVVTQPAGTAAAEVLGYSVLIDNGRPVAIPPDGLKLGPGKPEFWMVVEDVLGLVDRREIVGRVGDVRVRVGLPEAATPPRPGERLCVHAERAYYLKAV
jgi:ABC-type sugar transport system ATPase subunit